MIMSIIKFFHSNAPQNTIWGFKVMIITYLTDSMIVKRIIKITRTTIWASEFY